MTAEITIRRVDSLPADLDTELMEAAARENFAPIQWLREEWDDGTNQFSEPGEAFYLVRLDGRLVGVCGLNRDPYANDCLSGRLRRLYVLPEFRRRGIGRKLMSRVLEDALSDFEVVNLRTFDDDSAVFFEAIGFSRIEGTEGITHTKTVA